jgi:predicted DNA-binding protein (MmcQ/YjbR family)
VAVVDALGKLRELCLDLPEVTETLGHGEPVWFVRKKRFVTYSAYHHDDRAAFWCAAPPGAQEELVDDVRYFRPPYVGHRGWVGVYLDTTPDWAEIAEIVQDAYRTVAPKSLVAQLAQR